MFYGLPFQLKRVGDLYEDPAARAAFLGVNPMGQVPALVLPSGQMMTETAAITLHLADLARSDLLVPGPDAPERAEFLRWLVFLVAAIYPAATYGDVPERFVPADQGAAYRARVDALRMENWRVMEAVARAKGGPWFLGPRMSAIDLYLLVMVHWRPGTAWFQAETPALWHAAQAAAALPALAPVIRRNAG